jgi:hypothetical protein
LVVICANRNRQATRFDAALCGLRALLPQLKFATCPIPFDAWPSLAMIAASTLQSRQRRHSRFLPNE